MKEYEFLAQGNDIRINRLDLPYPWVNYLTNTRMSAMISQAGGGFVWYKSPVRLRISRYRYHQVPADSPGFYIYIREENGDIWSPTFQPMRDSETERYALHRPGETEFYAKRGDTEARLSFFIPPDVDVLVWELTLTNNSNSDKSYEIFAYTELAQFDWRLEQSLGYYWQHMLRTKYDEQNETLLYMFNFVQDEFYHKYAPLVYFASDISVDSFSGDRDAFIGDYRGEDFPIALIKDELGGEEIWSGNPCAALKTTLKSRRGETKTAHYFLGAAEGALVDYELAKENVNSTVKALREKGFVEKQRKVLRERLESHFSHYRCEIPDKDMQRQINIWGPLNAFQFSLFHETPQPSAPGIREIGARDKLQALMPITYRNPKAALEGLKFMLSAQYENGSIAHEIRGYMHEYMRPSAYKRDKIKSDDHLWSVFLAYAVASELDIGILDEKIPFRDLNGIPTKEVHSVWTHLMRVVDFTASNLGPHGLPHMLNGDWNDIICKFSSDGNGESVFAGQQFVVVLDKMIEMAVAKGYADDEKLLRSYREAQEEALLKYAWNGKWWYRCFDNNGRAIGCEEDKFGKLWLNPQTWAVISGVGSKEQLKRGLEAVENGLDTGCGLGLLTPGFATYPDNMDPFSPYNPGTGENGAIFCHAHTWSIIAEAKLGNAEKAWKYYTDLLPYKLNEHLGTDVYKSDPYGWVSNIVGPENAKHGWGNVIRFTGTAVWMNLVATQYLLGIRTKLDGIKFDPCIPSDWDEYRVVRDYLGCRLNVTFKNPDHVSKGVAFVCIDGEKHTENILPRVLFENKKQVDITVYLGK